MLSSIYRAVVSVCGKCLRMRYTEGIPREEWPDRSGTYFFTMKDDPVDRVKIGHSRSIADRMKDIEPVLPGELLLVAYVLEFYAEAAWHKEYKCDRIHHEWFRLSDKLFRDIELLKKCPGHIDLPHARRALDEESVTNGDTVAARNARIKREQNRMLVDIYARMRA